MGASLSFKGEIPTADKIILIKNLVKQYFATRQNIEVALS